MDDAVRALIMAFSVIVFVMALSFSMKMIGETKDVTDVLVENADRTKYFDHVEFVDSLMDDEHQSDTRDGTDRFVSAETVMPILYRYYKENFCVKIYGVDKKLMQVFDIKLEGDVHNAVSDTKATDPALPESELTPEIIRNKALIGIYDDKNDVDLKKIYMFGAPWLGSTKSVKSRVDYFINGQCGYINNQFVDYRKNEFTKARTEYVKSHIEQPDGTKKEITVPKYLFQEHFNVYAYTGDTMETEDGDILVTGAEAKDKVLISYYMIENPYVK